MEVPAWQYWTCVELAGTGRAITKLPQNYIQGPKHRPRGLEEYSRCVGLGFREGVSPCFQDSPWMWRISSLKSQPKPSSRRVVSVACASLYGNTCWNIESGDGSSDFTCGFRRPLEERVGNTSRLKDISPLSFDIHFGCNEHQLITSRLTNYPVGLR